MARKITYKPQLDSDPAFTQVGPHRFEAGKAVEVSDEVYEKLSKNPWFKGDKQAAERLAAAGTVSPGPASGLDSSVVPAYPPGSGMKYGEDTAMTADGQVSRDERLVYDHALARWRIDREDVSAAIRRDPMH